MHLAKDVHRMDPRLIYTARKHHLQGEEYIITRLLHTPKFNLGAVLVVDAYQITFGLAGRKNA